MRYTVRNVPDHLDAALRDSALKQGKSLNEVCIEALTRGVGLSELPKRKRDLSDIIGTWEEDPAFDEAIAEQDTVDDAIWQ